MEILFTILFEVIYLTILVSTGAFIRWLFSNRNKKIGELIEDRQLLNALIGAIVIFGAIFLVVLIL